MSGDEIDAINRLQEPPPPLLEGVALKVYEDARDGIAGWEPRPFRGERVEGRFKLPEWWREFMKGAR